MDDGVDAGAGAAARLQIGDIERENLVILPRRLRQSVGAQIGQAEAVPIPDFLPERRADAPGSAGEEVDRRWPLMLGDSTVASDWFGPTTPVVNLDLYIYSQRR